MCVICVICVDRCVQHAPSLWYAVDSRRFVRLAARRGIRDPANAEAEKGARPGLVPLAVLGFMTGILEGEGCDFTGLVGATSKGSAGLAATGLIGAERLVRGSRACCGRGRAVACNTAAAGGPGADGAVKLVKGNREALAAGAVVARMCSV